jgi:hypothetical protein
MKKINADFLIIGLEEVGEIEILSVCGRYDDNEFFDMYMTSDCDFIKGNSFRDCFGKGDCPVTLFDMKGKVELYNLINLELNKYVEDYSKLPDTSEMAEMIEVIDN